MENTITYGHYYFTNELTINMTESCLPNPIIAPKHNFPLGGSLSLFDNAFNK